MDHAKFFAAVRSSLFGGRLSANQVDGMKAILVAWLAAPFDLRWLAYMLATAYHETDRTMCAVSENLNYSASGLLATFPKYFTISQAAAYARQPQRIANRAYANRMGNRNEASGDGWNYRGRGLPHLTGRGNYRAAGSGLGLPLEQNPDRVADPEAAVLVGAWYWKANGLNALADRWQLDAITRGINGAAMAGRADRVERCNRALDALLSAS